MLPCSLVWELVESGQYQEACRVADEDFSATGSLPSLRNKLRALLRLARYGEASKLCDDVIKLSRYRNDGDFAFRGVAEWLDGREADAIASWQAGFNPTYYTDAAGGVAIPLLLRFASIKQCD